MQPQLSLSLCSPISKRKKQWVYSISEALFSFNIFWSFLPLPKELCWQCRVKTQHICMKVTPFILNSTFLQGYVMSVALRSTLYFSVCLQSLEHEQLFLNLAFHVRGLKLKLNLICWRIQILRITAGKERNVSQFNYPLTVLPAPPPPIIPLIKMPLIELTLSRVEKSSHWWLMTKGLGGLFTLYFCSKQQEVMFGRQLAWKAAANPEICTAGQRGTYSF